jgi:antitoxin (DNA-binding transcriptional repressor) of toxin-antitoxin stability system
LSTQSLRDVRDELSEVIDRVEHQHERVVVTRIGKWAARMRESAVDGHEAVLSIHADDRRRPLVGRFDESFAPKMPRRGQRGV